MLRTTVYLDEATMLDLRQLADTQHRSQAEIIRDALATYISQVKPTKRPAIAGIGSYRSGRNDISEKAEELLSQAARNSR